MFQHHVECVGEFLELGYGDAVTVNGKLSGTVTGLPVKGSIVDQGKAVYHVDNSPVVLLYGTLPMYRTLATGVEGADVKQFEQNLAALGYKGFTVDDEYTSATAAAVKKWQGDLGLTKTGTVEPGRVVYAAGQIRIDSHKGAVGDEARGALLTYTAQARVAKIELDTTDQRLAVKDAPVKVKRPDGKTVDDRIADTATTVEEQENQSTTKIQVTVAADEKAFEGLDQAALDVIFTASKRENVPTVPVAALLAMPDGGYGVQLADGTVVPVQTGLFAGGRVEVTGVDEGTIVGMPA